MPILDLEKTIHRWRSRHFDRRTSVNGILRQFNNGLNFINRTVWFLDPRMVATTIGSIFATYPSSIDLTPLIAMVQVLLRIELGPQYLLFTSDVGAGAAHATFRIALVI